jgi:hypothetical protein
MSLLDVPARRTAVTVAVVLVLAGAAGCGDDERGAVTVEGDRTATTGTGTSTAPPETTGGSPSTTPTATVETPDSSQPPPSTSGSQAPPAGGSPEDQQGGAGDEIPASSQALFTGRGGRISPRVVRVPPFIAIRVELRSADGERYGLAAGGRSVRAGGPVEGTSAVFDGLRPGKRLVLSGPGGRVVVEASAEPGP